jgi:hypothetical protein
MTPLPTIHVIYWRLSSRNIWRLLCLNCPYFIRPIDVLFKRKSYLRWNVIHKYKQTFRFVIISIFFFFHSRTSIRHYINSCHWYEFCVYTKVFLHHKKLMNNETNNSIFETTLILSSCHLNRTFNSFTKFLSPFKRWIWAIDKYKKIELYINLLSI